MCEKIEVKAKSNKEWIEVFPYDLIIGFEVSRPVLVFKDEHEKNVLPVYISSVDAQLAAHSGIHRHLKSPHDASIEAMKQLGLKLTKCVFIKIENQQQIVELFYEGEGGDKKISFAAENVMSLCLQSKAKFYSTLNMMKQSKELTTKTTDRSNLLSTPDIHPATTHVPYLN